MLRFRIGSIPVEVRPTHLLLAALIGFEALPAARSSSSDLAAAGVVLGGVAVFVSILVHELGHALVARLYGFSPSIVIEMFGGHTTPNATRKLSWIEQVILSLAGPLAGLTLGIACWIGLAQVGPSNFLADLDNANREQAPLFAQMLAFLVLANGFWTVMNLMPVMPLDGGHIAHTIFTRIFGQKGLVVSQGLSLVVCAALTAWGVATGSVLLAFLFGLFAFQAVRVLSAYFKSTEAQKNAPPPHPADLAFAQSAALFGQSQYPEAREVAEKALDAWPAPPPQARERLHHLLGWIAIKEGRGEEALRHFSQLGGQGPEPQALAAAWSLVDEDEKALPLWELAHRTTGDATVANEWAATLIRLGRVPEARQIPGVNLEEAWRIAAHILYLRADFDAAARVGAQAVEQFPSAELAYNAACAFSRAGRLEEAQRMLDRAASLGFKDVTHAESDADLAALRQTAGFHDWLRRMQHSARP
ncbi:MAG: site-2 protease family protein [Myxococcaceae bacterium]|nr:site-2 protease family protein [Myxococcaceae bacterium]